jgi:hypothetical protein
LAVEAFSSLKLSPQFTITNKLTTPIHTKPQRTTCIYSSNRKVATVAIIIINIVLQQVRVAVLVGTILPLMWWRKTPALHLHTCPLVSLKGVHLYLSIHKLSLHNSSSSCFAISNAIISPQNTLLKVLTSLVE